MKLFLYLYNVLKEIFLRILDKSFFFIIKIINVCVETFSKGIDLKMKIKSEWCYK